MHTTATLHVHPKVTDPLRVFEVRHLAIVAGCIFITSKPKKPARATPSPFDPNDGGRAA
ncbi:hypothetical protein KBY08_15955 [Pseudomonas sp. P135]|uniref:hypothetical protein n=1 Tax=Pseudomonas sp. P135 TaxID=2730420 RepID=UPI001CE2D6C3|nr:hypothetical protein [Pseudomonas sp. P135]MCA5973201.1 hypothetical protein [Pseudomonas sp. P135]